VVDAKWHSARRKGRSVLAKVVALGPRFAAWIRNQRKRV
jgi:hypothetical protein